MISNVMTTKGRQFLTTKYKLKD